MTVRTEVVAAEVGITVQEAAQAYGVSEKTIRRRIKEGKLSAYQVPTAQGHEWRITSAAPEEQKTVIDADGQELAQDGPKELARPDSEPAIMRALHLIQEQQEQIADLHRRNEELLAEAAYQRGRSEAYEREIAEARQQLKALASPPAAASRRVWCAGKRWVVDRMEVEY